MNKFQQSEKVGRDYFKSWLDQLNATDIEFAEDDYSCIDCNFKYKDYNFTAEIKVRDEKYRDYPTHYLEYKKYDSVMGYKIDNNKDSALYANFFGENWLYIYQLHHINPDNNKVIELPKTTAGYQAKKEKRTIEIPTDKAQVFYRENKESKWIKL